MRVCSFHYASIFLFISDCLIPAFSSCSGERFPNDDDNNNNHNHNTVIISIGIIALLLSLLVVVISTIRGGRGFLFSLLVLLCGAPTRRCFSRSTSALSPRRSCEAAAKLPAVVQLSLCRSGHAKCRPRCHREGGAGSISGGCQNPSSRRRRMR